ncbi:proline dehydrogenase family protein [Halorubrum luteum]
MIPPIARRFVAGESAAEALEHARQCNGDGIAAVLALAGEHNDRAGARADTTAYLDLIDDLAATDLDASLSVTPTQIGLDVSPELFERNYRRIVTYADRRGAFVWCETTDAPTTETTVDVFEELASEFPWRSGIHLRSRLKRTREDLSRLVDVPGSIRIGKGPAGTSSTSGRSDASATVAYADPVRADEAFRGDVEHLFEHRDRGVAVGSHDPEILSLATRLGDEFDTDYEIQLPMGVRPDAQRDLAAQGITVSQYVPYGDAWLSYLSRRVGEYGGILPFAVRVIAGRYSRRSRSLADT